MHQSMHLQPTHTQQNTKQGIYL